MALSAEVDAVAGAEINSELEHALANRLGVRQVASPIRVSAVLTFAAAAASKPLNQAPKALRPRVSIYSSSFTSK